MKKKIKNIFIVFSLVSILLLLSVNVVNAQLNGTYTVGTAGDYSTINNAIAALSSCGINGAVVFELQAETFNERITLTAASVSGSSAINTVTFRGITGSEITYATATSARSVIEVDGASHLCFENLTLSATGITYGLGVWIGGGSENIEVTNCEINISSISISIHNSGGVIVSGSQTSFFSGASNVSDILIQDNTIIGGYSGIYAYGLTTDYIEDVRIIGNDILESYYYGIYLRYTDKPYVHNNLINIRSTGSPSARGIFFYYNDGPFTITKNCVTNSGERGFFINFSNSTSSSHSLIANNSIGGSFINTSTIYGLYIANSDYIDIFYNSINCDANLSGSGCTVEGVFVESTSVGLDIKNNSFAYTGSSTIGTVYAAYYQSTSSFEVLDYNNYYSAANLVYYGGSAIANIADLKTAGSGSGCCQNSKEGNPDYTSTTNLLPDVNGTLQLKNAGTAIPTITDDIDGVTRDASTPDIGAYEFKLLTLPIELISFAADCQNNEFLLRWTTASEINNDFFTIEISENSRDWNEIATIDGAGNSNQLNNYEYIHSELDNEKLYYFRLKQTDYDGRFSYSKIISVQCINNISQQACNVFPNPFEDNLTLEFDYSTKYDYQYSIIDCLGREVKSGALIKGNNTYTLLFDNSLPLGIYQLNITSEFNNYQKKVIKN